MNDFLIMLRMIMSEEAYSSTPYLDTNGVWTVGFGSTIMYTRSRQRVSAYTHSVSRDEAIDNLYCGIAAAVKIAQTFVNNFATLSSVRQCVLVMMAYQMGNGLLTFGNTKRLIESNQHDEVPAEMMNSKWARIDSPNRAKRTTKIYKQDEWL